jgi:hypothetical protein
VSGQTSATSVLVFVGNAPSVEFIDGHTLSAGGTLGVDTAIPGDTVELFPHLRPALELMNAVRYQGRAGSGEQV